MVACVGVQQHLRLFRDGLGLLLDQEDDIEVVGIVRTAEELVSLCNERRPEVVVLDAAAPDGDVARVATALHRAFPSMKVIGLTVGAPRPAETVRARRCGISALVSRAGGMAEILGAIRNTNRHVTRMQPLAAAANQGTPPPAPTVLTEREVMVLKLVGAGCTSREISTHLEISHKTVENHKQRIFRKLGVQNQAHAVSVAMRAGQLRPDRIG